MSSAASRMTVDSPRRAAAIAKVAPITPAPTTIRSARGISAWDGFPDLFTVVDDRGLKHPSASTRGEEIDRRDPSSPIRVLLVEDHPIVTRGLEALIAGEADVEVAATCTTSAEAVDHAAIHDLDVVVLPWRLGGRATGRQLARALAAVSTARLVIYTGFVPGVDLPDDPVPGAVTVAKTASPGELLTAVRTAAGNRQPTSPTTSAGLTPRESQVLRCLLQGLSNAEIAELMTVELSTVKTHVRGVLHKLGVASRRELVGQVSHHRAQFDR